MGCLEVFCAAGVWVERQQLKCVKLSLGASTRVKSIYFSFDGNLRFYFWEFIDSIFWDEVSALLQRKFSQVISVTNDERI